MSGNQREPTVWKETCKFERFDVEKAKFTSSGGETFYIDSSTDRIIPRRRSDRDGVACFEIEFESRTNMPTSAPFHFCMGWQDAHLFDGWLYENERHHREIAEIDRRFACYGVPDEQSEDRTELHDAARLFAQMIREKTSDSREKQIALQKIEESIMWADAALTRIRSHHNDAEGE